MPSWKKIIVSGSAGTLSALTVSTHITASGHVSASSTSTGSFGAVNVVGMSVSNLVDVSSSFSTRVSNLKTDSGSFSTRVTRNEATGSSLTTASSSFSTRVSTEESNVDSLQTDSGSFSTRVSNLKSDSGSFSTRITAVTSSISALKTDSGSFSTRVAAVESFDIDDDLTFAGDSGGNLSINLDSETLTIAGGTNATTVGSGNGVTVNVDDSFLVNNASDTTSGTITAAGLITSGNVSGSIISTGSFGRLEAIIGPFFELDGDGDIMPL